MPNELQALGLLGNALVLPKRLENASRYRAQLTQNADVLGLTPALIDQLAPDPGLGGIDPTEHPGTYGKILSSVGGVGNVITSLLGSPLEAPRLELSTLTSLSDLRDKAEKKKATETYAGTFSDPQSQAAIRAGRTPPRGGTGSMQEPAMLYRQGKARGMTDEEANDYALEKIGGLRLERAGAMGRQASEIRVGESLRKETGKQQLAAGRVERLITPLRGAIDRQLKADSLFSRLVQGGKLEAFKQAPGTVGRLMGLSGEEASQLSDDIAIIESPGAFAGQILKGMGEDAGRLSDFDIQRVADRMPSKWDAELTANAKLKVFENMVRTLSALTPEQIDEAARAADRAVQELTRIDQGGDKAGKVHVGTSAAPPAPGTVAPAGEDFEILDVKPKR